MLGSTMVNIPACQVADWDFKFTFYFLLLYIVIRDYSSISHKVDFFLIFRARMCSESTYIHFRNIQKVECAHANSMIKQVVDAIHEKNRYTPKY